MHASLPVGSDRSGRRWVERPVAWFALAVCLLANAGSRSATETDKAPVQTLELREWFVVGHPAQVVEFALAAPAASGKGRLLDEAGNPVPFQLVENGRKLALRTDLPAGARRTWRWFADSPSQAMPGPGVRVQQTPQGWEISNELIAFRVPNSAAIKAQAGAPGRSPLLPLVDLFNYGRDTPRILALAPIQGVRLRDGTWSALGPNALVAVARGLTNAEVQMAESGPLKAVVRFRYEFDKPPYAYGQVKVSDPGPGYLAVTITMLAGEPSILFEEETDLDEVWAASLYEGLAPDQARYAGHHSSSPRFGHMPDGTIYLPSHARGEVEAAVDLQYQRPQTPCYIASDATWRYMAIWDPWVFDSGWYWQLFKAGADGDANLVAIFAGPAARALGAGMSGAGIFTLPADPREPAKPVAGIASQSYRRSPFAQLYPKSRFSWGLFLGVKGKDLPEPTQVPTVNRQANLFAGALNLTKLAAMKLDFPDPPQGYGGLYMDRAALADVIQRVRQGKASVGGMSPSRDTRRGDTPPTIDAYRWLHTVEPSSRPLFDAWADPTGAKMRAAAADIGQLAKDLSNALVHGRGIRTFRFGYWHGGLEMMRRGLWIDQALASDALAPDERARVKAAACLFAYVLWDNDFVPLDNDAGLNLGTANMPQQQQGYRNFYAMLLAAHPDFAARAARVADGVLLQVKQQINEGGAHFGCAHYIAASFAPTLNTLMQVKQLGQADPFRTEPRLAQFAEFYLNLLTPPEVRFPGKPRCYIALGDSSTEASPLYGQLGTAFRDADPALSRRLMGAWQANGKPHSGFFGTTVMAIDERLPAQDPGLRSATFPGYYSVLRSGYGTPNETAAWVVNGDFYQDHRHADAGEVVLYALSVPLSVDWGTIYSPQTGGAFFHSSILPEAAIGRPWDQSSPPPDTAAGGAWRKAAQASFATGRAVDSVASTFAGKGIEWKRLLQLHHEDPAMPVIAIRDDFDGPSAGEPKVLTLNLMARGPVQTPAGAVTPEPRTHPPSPKADKPDQLPSASPPFALKAGVSQLSFTGQHGVDFDLFVIAQQAQEALLGNWADTWTQQGVPKWEERQHILRVRGTGPFHLVLVPYHSGQRPANLKLEAADGGLVLTAGGAQRKLPH